ncbi:unnamed protein product [Prunus brigantina]
MIRTVLIARESSLSHKDFRPHLLVAKTIVEARILIAYSDVDWVVLTLLSFPSLHGSQLHNLLIAISLFYCPNPISWQSKKQPYVSQSSTKAEYRALAHTSADISWIRHVLQDLKVLLPQQPILHSDNLSALALSSNPVYHSRIKHLDVNYHFVRERVQ